MTERNDYPQRPPFPHELAVALGEPTFACLTIGTDEGTAFIIKAPSRDIEAVRGRVSIYLAHELYDHPAAPVIRLALRIYDDPLAPLAMESFINVAEPDQRADYAALADQQEIPLLFYDETLEQRVAKRITHTGGDIVPDILAAADALLTHIAPARFSFEAAKYAVQEATRL